MNKISEEPFKLGSLYLAYVTDQGIDDLINF